MGHRTPGSRTLLALSLQNLHELTPNRPLFPVARHKSASPRQLAARWGASFGASWGSRASWADLTGQHGPSATTGRCRRPPQGGRPASFLPLTLCVGVGGDLSHARTGGNRPPTRRQTRARRHAYVHFTAPAVLQNRRIRPLRVTLGHPVLHSVEGTTVTRARGTASAACGKTPANQALPGGDRHRGQKSCRPLSPAGEVLPQRGTAWSVPIPRRWLDQAES
jgi:hypothetical protein